MSPSWYAVVTEPNREHIARNYLATWIEDIYMPVCEKRTALDIHERNQITSTQHVTGPILRGYIFVRLDMSDAAANEISQTRGVLNLLPNKLRPQAIPSAAIDRLRKACDALTAAPDSDTDCEWMIGKLMRVSRGTYQGYQGDCIGITKGCAVLLLEMFKKVIPVPVPIECIDRTPICAASQDVDDGKRKAYIPGISKRRSSKRSGAGR